MAAPAPAHAPRSSAAPWFSPAELAAESPSARRGMPPAAEREALFEAAGLVALMGQRAGAAPEAVAAASVYLRVFYARRALQEHDADTTSVAALMLAADGAGAPLEANAAVTVYWAVRGGAPAAEQRPVFREAVAARRAELGRVVAAAAGGAGPAPRVVLPHGRVALLVADVYGGNATLPGARGPVTVEQLANASALAVNDCFRTAACLEQPPETVAAAAFWMAHRVLRVGQPLVTSPAAGGAFVPWHAHWGVSERDMRAVAAAVAEAVGPELAAALGAGAPQPPPRRVAHARPRPNPARPSDPPAAARRGAQPCPRCQGLFVQAEYVAHRAACKASHEWCVPCGAVHRDSVAAHRASCRLECATCGEDVLAAAHAEHAAACGAGKTAAAAGLEVHTPPSGPGQKRFRSRSRSRSRIDPAGGPPVGDDAPDATPRRKRRKSGVTNAALSA